MLLFSEETSKILCTNDIVNSSPLPVKIKAVDNKYRGNIACSCWGRYPNPEIIHGKTFRYNFKAAALLKASFVSLLVMRDRQTKLPSCRHHDKFRLYIIQSKENELCAETSWNLSGIPFSYWYHAVYLKNPAIQTDKTKTLVLYNSI